MTLAQHQRAKKLREKIGNLQGEIAVWRETEGRLPLVMIGKHLVQLLPEGPFEEFRQACVATLDAELQKAKSEFAKL